MGRKRNDSERFVYSFSDNKSPPLSIRLPTGVTRGRDGREKQ